MLTVRVSLLQSVGYVAIETADGGGNEDLIILPVDVFAVLNRQIQENPGKSQFTLTVDEAGRIRPGQWVA